MTTKSTVTLSFLTHKENIVEECDKHLSFIIMNVINCVGTSTQRLVKKNQISTSITRTFFNEGALIARYKKTHFFH